MTVPIVGIAASAGGLEAISELLAALPSRTGLAFIVVQHLDPEHESHLPELLGKKVAMPVEHARDGAEVERDHVYVIPPNASLTFADARLCLGRRESGPHHPADLLFNSMADELGDAAIGVVLSGGDSDGTLGIQAIKHGGGITFAQTPDSARFPGMPEHAIATGCIDFVLRPKEIADELMRLKSHPYLTRTPRSETSTPGPGASAPEDENLRRIFRRLRSAHGVDFSLYKRSTIWRRLARRMALQKTDDLTEYLAFVESNPAEVTALYQDFLIRVTGFFRDPPSLRDLSQNVFPGVCDRRPSKMPIRIWVPGCATGEEVYSIAILLMEYLGERLPPAGIQIFGTDVGETAIQRARTGVYPDGISEQVSGERLQRFFVKQQDGYRIAKQIRDLCVFARHDVTRDPPFSRVDLISCRNLLIYLEAKAQRRVMQAFHYALRPQGFLVLGPSESVGLASDLFEVSDRSHRVYKRSSTRIAANEPTGALSIPEGQSGNATNDASSFLAGVEAAPREADRLLLTRYAPASVLVDDALNILQFRGETGPYLEHASGAPSLNLQRVARPELLLELIPAVQEARETGAETHREGLSAGDLQDISVTVIPLRDTSAERCYVIVFEDPTRPQRRRDALKTATGAPLTESDKDRQLARFERENAAIRDHLQAVTEEHEAFKEELKSAHEEVLSANEEFQSTNEELETAKEELQSANEELTTTNDELLDRNRELGTLNAELQKQKEVAERARARADVIVDTVREPLLVLDETLRVVRANQAFYDDFGATREQSEGRFIYALGENEWITSELRARLLAVLSDDEPVEDVEVSHTLPVTGERTVRLNARRIPGHDERPELILLAITDVTRRKAIADALAGEARRKDEFLATLAHELRNPMSAITHAVHLLQRTDVGTSAPRLYEMIARQSQALVRLVDELLDVARISRGLIEVKKQIVDFTLLAREVAAMSRSLMEERDHEFLVTIPDEPLWVMGDPVRLAQVITNLLDNAAKYTEPSGRIALQVQQLGGNAVLSVRDNGIGLASGTIEGIFDLFVQVDHSLAHSRGGLGIGLTLARRVLDLHGGHIEARSAGLGRGSEFVVHIPVVAPADATRRARSAERVSVVAAAARRHVLIIDDNVDAAEAMALLVRAWGHEVATAVDADSGLELIERFAPDMVLLDIGLPGMNGYDMARHLRADARYADMQLVAITGYGRAEDRSAAYAAGFDAHLVKPAEPDDLQALLARGAGERSTSGQA